MEDCIGVDAVVLVPHTDDSNNIASAVKIDIVCFFIEIPLSDSGEKTVICE
jgi:hypothetical protein